MGDMSTETLIVPLQPSRKTSKHASASTSVVRQPHCVPHIAHRFRGEPAGLVAAVSDNRTQQRRIVHVLLGALEHRLLLAQNAFDHRLLAVETTDSRRTAA